PSIYYQGENWGVWAYYTNSYSEKYYSYLGDHVRTYETDSTHYAKYYFEFGNPYTSNIDLSNIGDMVDNLNSVYRINGATWNIQDGSTSTILEESIAMWDGTNWAGSDYALIVPPFETFVIGLNEGADDDSSIRTFTFDDSLKTFDYSLAQAESDPGFGRLANLNYYNWVYRDNFFQLRLKLFNEYDEYVGNEVYVVVKRNVENGVLNKLESHYPNFGNRTGVFLAQENADGSEVAATDQRMYINVVDFSYAAKPIQLFFNRKAGDYNGYYLKADLFDQSIFNKLTTEQNNYAGNNSFYFYDKFEDVLLPITTDFNYYIEYSDNPLEDRYQVFWNGGPMSDDRLSVEEELNYQTIIYKDQDTYKIRFNANWNTAQIKLYDLSGKILQTYENVKTDVDFEIELPGAGVYVVKLVSEKGEIHTQKIINY
ncbi:MAG TPA: T9SS type A sorting domain-containing protein, partial [Moheibacter sp.]|nr:T9SS type A sorting domain-containing protein [Moheibacter sp.]